MKHPKNIIIQFILGLAIAFGLTPSRRATACNIGEGTHETATTKITDSAFANRNLLCKVGSDADHIAICGAANLPLGVVPDEPASGDFAAVKILAKGPTKKMVASGAIAAGAKVYTAANGKVQAEPSVAGTYYCVGTTLNAAAADLDVIEVADGTPHLLTVITGAGVTDVPGIKAALNTAGQVKFV